MNSKLIPVTVVYMANDDKIKGGWADRLYGMLSLYKICKRYGFRFKINFTVPFDLSDYLLPRYDWKISQDEIARGKASGVTIASFATDIPLPEYSDIAQYNDTDFDGLCAVIEKLSKSHEYIFCYTNRNGRGDHKRLFDELFCLSPELQSAVGFHRDRMSGGYVAAAFRFLSLFGDFEERGDRPTLPAGLRDVFIKRNIGHLMKIRDSNKGKKILVCSDSAAFINAASKHDFIYAVGGKRRHIDVPEIEEEAAMLTFVDFFLISRADAVYSVLDGVKCGGTKYECYNGGFSRLASRVGGAKFELIDHRCFFTKVKRYKDGFMRRLCRVKKILTPPR